MMDYGNWGGVEDEGDSGNYGDEVVGVLALVAASYMGPEAPNIMTPVLL